MEKIELNIIPSVNTSDITRFIEKNSDMEWNKCCEVLGHELSTIQENLPNEIEMENEYCISKVIVSELKYDGWIKKFTETQGMTQDYYILFTN